MIWYSQVLMALADHLALGFASPAALEAAVATVNRGVQEPDSEPEPIPFPPGNGLLAAPDAPDHPSGNGLLAYDVVSSWSFSVFRVVLRNFSGEGYCQRTRRRHSGSGVRLSQLRRR